MRNAIIVGAGTFGASLAWLLARDGVAVTLVDQYAPGDARASSGGETRLIRCGHGDDALYTASARRAWTLWRELEAETGADLIVDAGIAWFAHREDGWEAAAMATLAQEGIPFSRLEPGEAARLWPSCSPEGLAFVVLEHEAGALRAARCVEALAAAARAHGAGVERARAVPDGERVRLADGRVLEADVVVWACGAWLGGLFGDLVPVRPALQELYFVGGGPGWAGTPGYIDYDRAFYGTGDIDGLGVKAAHDADGPFLDPDAELPPASAAGEARARALLAERFPALAGAPLTRTATCRYELSPDSHFLCGPHPEHPSVWVIGGGSGHGFKHGPAMAERLLGAWRGGAPLPGRFALGPRAPGRSLRTAGGSADYAL